MAELTNLETKLGEVIGLAMAAQVATEKVEKLTSDRQLKKQLQTMRKEAALAEKEGTAVAASIDGKKGKIHGSLSRQQTVWEGKYKNTTDDDKGKFEFI